MTTKRTTLFFAIVIVIALALQACGAQPSSEAPVVQTAHAEAQQIKDAAQATTIANEANAQATAIIAAALGTPTPTATQILRPADTVTPMPETVYDNFTATPNSYPWECYFAGARMADDKIPGAERIGGSGKCDINALINGVSLQPYWEEVVTYDTILPAGLDRNDVATASFEPINDFLRVIAVRHGPVMYYIVLDADESAGNFAFWWTSYIKYDVESMTLKVCKDDSSKNPGGFNGSCSGIWKEFSGMTSDRFSGEILTYINAINELAAKGWTTPSKPMELDSVWFEAWPPQ